MSKIREVLMYKSKTPVLDDFTDYKRSINITIFIVYYFIYCLVWALPDGSEIKIIVDIPLLIIMIFLYRKLLLRDLKIFKDNLKQYILFIIEWFAIIYIIGILGSVIMGLFTPLRAPNSAAIIPALEKSVFFTFMCIAIGAPIMEELMFRRIIRINFKSKFVYYVVSSLLFGIAHIIVGFSFPLALAFAIPYVIFGLGFATIFDKTRNIWCAVFVHMLYNMLAFASNLASL